jgi:hypothetical protein
MTSHRVDDRTRRDRVENQIHQWGVQMSKLLDAYLNARTRNDGEGMPKMSDQLSDLSVAPPISMLVIDMFCMSRTLP